MEHMWIFLFSCWQLPGVSVSGIVKNDRDATFELMTYCFTLSPNILSQVQLQESGPSLINSSQTLPSPVLSQVIPSTVVATGLVPAAPKEGLEWLG
jgi:hypothetical protein